MGDLISLADYRLRRDGDALDTLSRVEALVADVLPKVRSLAAQQEEAKRAVDATVPRRRLLCLADEARTSADEAAARASRARRRVASSTSGHPLMGLAHASYAEAERIRAQIEPSDPLDEILRHADEREERWAVAEHLPPRGIFMRRARRTRQSKRRQTT